MWRVKNWSSLHSEWLYIILGGPYNIIFSYFLCGTELVRGNLRDLILLSTCPLSTSGSPRMVSALWIFQTGRLERCEVWHRSSLPPFLQSTNWFSSSWYFESTVQGDYSACDKPPVDLTVHGPQNGTFVLKSTGGLSQPEWSPCSGKRKMFDRL